MTIKYKFPMLRMALIVSITIWGGWHCIATLLYLAPQNPLTRFYDPAVQIYMRPFFSQNWNLFAPEPATSSLSIWYRCQEGNWYDISAGLIEKHWHNRFSSNGKLNYIVQDLARVLFNNRLTESQSSQVVFEPHYYLYLDSTKKLVASLCNSAHKNIGIKRSAEFKVIQIMPMQFSELKKPTDNFNYVEFNFPKFITNPNEG